MFDGLCAGRLPSLGLDQLIKKINPSSSFGSVQTRSLTSKQQKKKEQLSIVTKKHLFVSFKSLIIAWHNTGQMQANSALGRLVFIKLL